MNDMRRETRKSKKSKNAISSLLDETAPEGSGVIVEEIESLEMLKLENNRLTQENLSLKNDIQSIAEAKNIEIKNLKTQIISLKKDSKAQESRTPLLENDELIIYKYRELQAVGVLNLYRAIKEESEIQVIETPVISRSIFESYRVNGASIVKSKEALETHGYIKIIKDHHRQTRYQILKELPTCS